MRSGTGARRVALILALAGVTAFAAVAETASAAPPATTAARSGPPNSVALLGDSISAGTGTAGLPSAEQPANSWGTGTNAAVQSIYSRLLAINPAISGNRYPMAANGKKMTDMAGQASSMPASTELVLVEMGGNDLCKDSVPQMTSLSDYRSQFVAGLNAIAARSPNALISVSSIPDIFNLWFLRGAPNPPNSEPSSRAGTARLFWDTLAVIPCKSLVIDPTDMSEAGVTRREAVRARNIAFNQILAEECALRLRCRFDDNALFNFSSNRADPLSNGPYLPRADWQFVDDDISTIDHFHPSLSGQTKIAQKAWDSGFQYSDGTAPTVTTRSVSPQLPSGASLTAPTVTVGYSDPAGIKGMEYRLRTGAAAGSWQTLMSSSVSVPVNTLGVSWVETRAQDTNGNLSASSMTEVNFDPTAVPTPQITSAPSGLVNLDSATIQFTGGVAGLSYECKLDGAEYAPCSSPALLAGLGQAGHTWSVRLTDGITAGTAVSASWRVDSVLPDAPEVPSPPAEWETTKSASISFNGEPDADFTCAIDGATFSTCTSPQAFSVTTEGPHSFAVKQTDLAGNTGATRLVSWNVDTIAPGLPGLSGTPPGRTKSTTASLVITGENAFATFKCSVDNGAYGSCTSPLNLTGLADGPHSVKVKQYDRAGNESATRSSATWTVDTSPPDAPQLSGAPAGLTSATSASIAFLGEAGGTFQCSLDSAPFQECTSPQGLTGLEDGPHVFSVRQRDQAGNLGDESSASWEVDSGALAPTLTSVPPALTQSGSASIAFTGKDGASFSCAVDSDNFSSCSSPLELNGLGDGGHTVKVRQTDLAGNTSPPAAASWTRDSTAPAAPNVTAPRDIVHPVRNHSLAFTGESGGSFECRKDGGAWTSCVSPAAANFLSDGTHNLDVRQIDAAGNIGPHSTATWRIDTAAPAAPGLTGAPSGTVRSTAATLTLGSESGAAVECRLNGAAWSACSSPWAMAGLGQGAQRAEVRQVDAAGNSSPVSSADWSIDTVAPALTKLTGTAKGKKRKRKTTLKSAYNKSLGKPKSLEYSTSKRKPSATAPPKKVQVRGWNPKKKIKGKKKIRWVRVSDEIGNQSPWYRVR